MDAIANVPANVPWWAWLVLAAVLWLLQLIISVSSDKSIPENKHPMFFSSIRVLLVVAMILCALVGIIRFVKAVWSA